MEKFTSTTSPNLTSSKSEPDNLDLSSGSKGISLNSPPGVAHLPPSTGPPPPAPQLLSSDPIIPTLKGKVELLNRVNIDLIDSGNDKPFAKRASPFENMNTATGSSPNYHHTVKPRSPLELLNNNDSLLPPTKLHGIGNDSNRQLDSNKRVKLSSGSDYKDQNLSHPHQIEGTLPNMSIISERRISLPSYDSSNIPNSNQFDRVSKGYKLPTSSGPAGVHGLNLH
ncbi:hypothetical protein CONCODRAFT_13807, partial [Conidiobolus coronatus NRRL 28638]